MQLRAEACLVLYKSSGVPGKTSSTGVNSQGCNGYPESPTYVIMISNT